MISVIVPTFEEESALPRLIEDLAAQETAAEIIVVDGGSRDRTIEIARMAGVTLLEAPRNRGAQIARGAAAARGDVLLFLHADCRLAAGGLVAIEAALARAPDAPGGNFRLLFDGDERFSRWLDSFYAYIRRHGFYYGDSGVFVRRDVYRAIGGIRPLAVMEDHDFNRRLERVGKTITIAEPALATPSRKFRGRRPAAIVAGWLLVHALFHLGVPDRWLARIYYPRRWWRSPYRIALRDQS